MVTTELSVLTGSLGVIGCPIFYSAAIDYRDRASARIALQGPALLESNFDEETMAN